VPEDAPDAVRQPGLLHAIQQSSVDRLLIGMIRGISLVRLDQGASHRAVAKAAMARRRPSPLPHWGEGGVKGRR
jgi:hypothetical protein